ncbi:hypothetical protein HWD94_20065 [Pseudarthrobacter equi]|uniref:hypothetical protein n=1 Tax=Pseudarthrobacter equi TaxID=728066 RepID=UPI0021C10EA4|nr:hypothetical protein [Pseudarthrobacter equi]MCT9627393.1 hypothetical protein [Pseudarthrobacter equi]
MTVSSNSPVPVSAPVLNPGEILVTNGKNDDEMLWRQVNPSYVDKQGKVTEQAFQPTSSDPRRLSCSRQKLQSEQGAFEHHTQVLNLKSAGTWAVSVAEVSAEQVHAVDDSAVQSQVPPTPGHTYIDYQGLNKTDRAYLRDALADAANGWGIQYPS